MPNVPQGLTGRIQGGAKQTVQQMAQAAASQAKNIIETANTQAGLRTPEKLTDSDIFDEDIPSIVTEAKKEPSIDVAAIHARDQALLADLEAKLAQIRQAQAQKLKEHNEGVIAQMQAQNAAPKEVSVEPQGKIRKAMGKVKKAVSTIMSRKQSETKQGSGKG